MSAIPAPALRGPVSLSERQSNGLNRFLLGGTEWVLRTIETMFEVEIEKSESLMEIAPANESEFLRTVNDRALYTISSDLAGDLQGRVCLLVQSAHVQHLADLMMPVLTLLFLSDADADLQTLERSKPGWMGEAGGPAMQDAEFQAQMTDLLGELGNVLIGSYTRTLFEWSALATRHSLPRVGGNVAWKDVLILLDHCSVQRHPGLIIQHHLQIGGRPVSLWCVISLVPDSLGNLLSAIESWAERKAWASPPRADAAQRAVA